MTPSILHAFEHTQFSTRLAQLRVLPVSILFEITQPKEAEISTQKKKQYHPIG